MTFKTGISGVMLAAGLVAGCSSGGNSPEAPIHDNFVFVADGNNQVPVNCVHNPQDRNEITLSPSLVSTLGASATAGGFEHATAAVHLLGGVSVQPEGGNLYDVAASNDRRPERILVDSGHGYSRTISLGNYSITVTVSAEQGIGDVAKIRCN